MATSDRRPYESATVLDQALLDESQDNLAQRLETIVEVHHPSAPSGIFKWSDRAKFVDDSFYENRVEFPEVERTVGQFLSGTLEFSDIELVINNTDQAFSNVLPGGGDYIGWIGRRVEMKIGLAELGTSYITVFDGFVTSIGGFGRDKTTFNLLCRNKFDSVNVPLPNQVFTSDDFPDIENEFLGLGVPIVYGDWNTSLRVQKLESTGLNAQVAAVPAFPVNGLDPEVNASLDPVDPNVGDTDLRCVISSTPLKSLDTSSVTLLRGDKYYVFDSGDITVVPLTDNQIFDIAQENLMIDGSPWNYNTGDQFFVKCDGVDLGVYDDNIVVQARDVLTRFGGITYPTDFDASWDTYRDKAAPAQSAVSLIKSRVWFQESAKAIDLVASLLEQVRLEPFIDRNNKWKVCSLHFDDFPSAPTYTVRNWDIGINNFNPQIDERNNFNQAKGDFDFNPASGQNRLSTELYENVAAKSQAGRAIGKLLSYPNLYVISDVENQVKEVLRLVSGYTELADCVLTSRSFLKDICDFMTLSIDIGSIEFDSSSQPIVAMIRSLRYTPGTMGIGANIWIYQMINFPGYTGPFGTVGGFDASITKVV